MFFMMGITQKQTKLDYKSPLIIHECSSYGRMEIFMTYNVLLLFLIPIFKWNKKYYVKYNCCNQISILNPEKGKLIESGENPTIYDTDLELYYKENYKICNNCNEKWSNNYEFCPKCGKKL